MHPPRLDNFDGPAVGEIAVGYEMFEEAFEIYKKFNLKVPAIKVLLDNMEDLDRANEFAAKVDESDVWSCLASAQLEHGAVSEAIASYLRGADTSRYLDVIERANAAGAYEELVKYLLMVRKKLRDAKVDSELAYAYARVGDLAALDEFITSNTQANLQSVGDRCVPTTPHCVWVHSLARALLSCLCCREQCVVQCVVCSVCAY